MMLKYTNEETVVLSVLNGMICSLLCRSSSRYAYNKRGLGPACFVHKKFLVDILDLVNLWEYT